jgi:hypothetical protein
MEASLLYIKGSYITGYTERFLQSAAVKRTYQFWTSLTLQPQCALARCHCIFPSQMKIYKLIFHFHPWALMIYKDGYCDSVSLGKFWSRTIQINSSLQNRNWRIQNNSVTGLHDKILSFRIPTEEPRKCSFLVYLVLYRLPFAHYC